MAEDNFAIQIDPPESEVQVDRDYDIEAGIGTSRCHLIEQFEQEVPKSLTESIQQSIKKSERKIKHYCSYVTKPMKAVLVKFNLLIVIALYSVFGAWLFTTLEVPHDLKEKEETYHSRLIARDVMILNLRAIHVDNREDRELRWKEAVLKFEEDLGMDEPTIETAWTFWMAFLYAGTIYTTIGYGNIACKTLAGQVATLVYAFVGIPIMIVILNELGDFLLKWVKLIAQYSSDTVLYLGVRWGVTKLEEGSNERLRFLSYSKQLSRAGLISSTSLSTVASMATLHDTDGEEPKSDPPVFSAIIATFGWIFLSAGVFCIWEDWDYFTSIYFFFISCSTIGLGDVVPAHPEYMIFAFGVVMIGLALVTVCINVVQEKLELMYFALLQKLLDDYMAAVNSGDPNAAAGMMSGFQGKAKFLMPLISKNQGAKVMNQFKDDCVAKGIDPPSVLTDIDPSTGMPAFANASKDEFKDYIEHAEEKAEEQRRHNEERLQSKSPSMILYSPVVMVEKLTISTQTAVPGWVLQKNSQSVQFSPECSDDETQTAGSESADEGIQCWPSYENISTQWDSDLELKPHVVSLSTTGVQPEVSSIYVAGSDDSSTASSSDSEMDDDFDMELPVSLPPSRSASGDDILGREMDQKQMDSLKVQSLQIQRLRKSISEESQDTVIHVSPSGSPTTLRKKIDEKKKEQKERKEQKRKEREERRAARKEAKGLRFLKNSGDQTCCESSEIGVQSCSVAQQDVNIQCLPSSREISTQFEKETKGRRCQTKVTCISSIPRRVPPDERRTSRMRPRLSTQQSIQSSVMSSELIESTSSYEDLQTRPSLASINQADFDTITDYADYRSSFGDDPLPLEEVSVNLSLISRPVDERGMIIMEEEEDDDVFASDDEMQQDDLEFYATSSSTQTALSVGNIETQTHRSESGSVTCQTELTTMRASVSSKKNIRSKLAETDPGTDSNVSQTLAREETSSEYETEIEGVRFMMDTCVQTAQTSFYADRGSTPDVGEELDVEIQKDQADAAEMSYNFLVDGTSQTTGCDYTVSEAQTDISALSAEQSQKMVQTYGELVEKVQKEVMVAITQTDEKKSTEEEAQTMDFKKELVLVETQTDSKEYTTLETQTIRELSNTGVQQDDAKPELLEIETQTVQLEVTVTEVQTDTKEVGTMEIQTDATSYSTLETQTVLECSDEAIQTSEIVAESREGETQTPVRECNSEETQTFKETCPENQTQTDLVSIQMTEVQTDHEDVKESEGRETQTEHQPELSSETQTDLSYVMESSGCQTESMMVQTGMSASYLTEGIDAWVDATIPSFSSKMQSDVSMFTVDLKDRSRLEVEHDVRFNVETGTSMDEKRLKAAETQSEKPAMDKTGVQCTPDLTTSHTQYVSSCQSDRKSQTDYNMKNKYSQEEIDDASSVSSKSMDLDEILKRGFGQSSVLWSDFDVVAQASPVPSENQADGFVSGDAALEPGPSTSKDKAVVIKVKTGYIEDAVQPEESSQIKDESTKTKDKKDDASTPKKKVIKKKKITKEVSLQAAPEMDDKQCQYEVRRGESGISAQPDTLEFEVQAAPDTMTAGSGMDPSEDWVKVYVAELDQERRMKMLDIGIQTGVLARVQHMYGKKDAGAAGDEQPPPETPKVSMRKTESNEQISGSSKSKIEGSDESLVRTSSVMSIAESWDGGQSAQSSAPSKASSRSSSFKKPKRPPPPRELKMTDQSVADLRSRFEKKPKQPERGRSSSSER